MEVRTVQNEDGSAYCIVISDAGRGGWSILCDIACGWELRGFNGENHLYIFYTAWQSGHYTVTVVHCQVDSETKVAEELVKVDELEAGINRLIRLVGITD